MRERDAEALIAEERQVDHQQQCRRQQRHHHQPQKLADHAALAGQHLEIGERTQQRACLPRCREVRELLARRRQLVHQHAQMQQRLDVQEQKHERREDIAVFDGERRADLGQDDGARGEQRLVTGNAERDAEIKGDQPGQRQGVPCDSGGAVDGPHEGSHARLLIGLSLACPRLAALAAPAYPERPLNHSCPSPKRSSRISCGSLAPLHRYRDTPSLPEGGSSICASRQTGLRFWKCSNFIGIMP
jgi:hypothetical protein